MNDTQNKIALWTGDYMTGVTDLREMLGQPFVANDCTIMLCNEGCAVVTTNGRKQALRKGDLVLLFSDVMLVPLRVSSLFSATYLCLSERLMSEVYYKLTSVALWEYAYAHPVSRLTKEQWSLVAGWLMQVEWVIAHVEAGTCMRILRRSVRSLLEIIEAEVRRLAPSDLGDYRKDRAWMLFGKFISLLTKHCRETREVRFYADSLCITPDYLYKICLRVQGQKPKDIINLRTVSELKRYLARTDLSIKDLAREFHFEDVSYLCRFFKRETGLSPQDYRMGGPGDGAARGNDMGK